MKKLTLIIHENLQEALADTLKTIPHIQGFTFIHVEGHGEEATLDHVLSARDQVIGYCPKIRTDLILQDQHVEEVLVALRAANMGLAGNTFYWITPVETAGRL